MVLWTDKYCPKDLKDVVGQGGVVEQVLIWFDNWQEGDKALLLAGPTGSGKTCLVYALGNEKDFEILELNASDLRNKSNIQDIVANSIMQQSLFKKGKIILIDEVDGVAGRKDYGGVAEIVRCIKDSKQRIILTANDPWNKKLSSLRKVVDILDLNKLSYLNIANFLKEICKKEKIKAGDAVLKKIAICTMGDLRAAINDLESLTKGKNKIEEKDLGSLGEREKEEKIFEVLRIIFKTKDIVACLKSFDKVNMNFDEILMWVDENLPLEYKGEELAKAYDALSKFDVFRGRIRRWQHWRFMVYQRSLLSAGVALSKEGKNKGYTSYQRSKRILKLYIAKMRFAKRNAIAEKLAKKMHVSKKKVIKDVLPYMPFILRDDDVKNSLNLEEEELKVLSSIQ